MEVIGFYKETKYKVVGGIEPQRTLKKLQLVVAKLSLPLVSKDLEGEYNCVKLESFREKVTVCLRTQQAWHYPPTER